jgi:hypothetical protein
MAVRGAMVQRHQLQALLLHMRAVVVVALMDQVQLDQLDQEVVVQEEIHLLEQELLELLTQVAEAEEVKMYQDQQLMDQQEVLALYLFQYLQLTTLVQLLVAQQSQLADLIQSSSGPQRVQVHTQLKDKCG